MNNELTNEQKINITDARIRMLKSFTMNGKTFPYDDAWLLMKAAGVVDNISKESFRGGITKYGFGMREGMIYERGLSLDKKPKKKKPEPIPPEYKPTYCQRLLHNMSAHLQRTLAP